MMFYLTQFKQECVYRVSGVNCCIIAERDGDELTVYDILSDKSVDPVKVCTSFGSEVKHLNFAFIPEDTSGLEKYLYKEEDTTFFVMGGELKKDMPGILSFPALVHA